MKRLLLLLVILTPALSWALPNQIMQEGLVMDREGTPLEGVDTRHVVIPDHRICDINTEEDWDEAERLYLLSQRAEGNHGLADRRVAR